MGTSLRDLQEFSNNMVTGFALGKRGRRFLEVGRRSLNNGKILSRSMPASRLAPTSPASRKSVISRSVTQGTSR
jgi:hypothetical protein